MKNNEGHHASNPLLNYQKMILLLHILVSDDIPTFPCKKNKRGYH